jgi:hypothetical protein
MIPATAYIESLEKDLSLLEETNFDRRADALEDLDALVDLDAVPADNLPVDGALKHRADNLRGRLSQIDERLFERLRSFIRQSAAFSQEAPFRQGSAFRSLVATYLPPRAPSTGYDNLDLFVNRLLSYRPLPDQTAALAPDMVYFQKTPAGAVFDMAEAIRFDPGDVFIDLGSGLGQVTLLIHLLTGIPAKGIEYEPAFCTYARDMAADLRLPGVSFDNADARVADVRYGTIFFMYTPFTGNLLAEVLARLSHESRKRKIRLITYGPCTADVAQATWLTPMYPVPAEVYAPAYFESI